MITCNVHYPFSLISACFRVISCAFAVLCWVCAMYSRYRSICDVCEKKWRKTKKKTKKCRVLTVITSTIKQLRPPPTPQKLPVNKTKKNRRALVQKPQRPDRQPSHTHHGPNIQRPSQSVMTGRPSVI